jgi:hypothetical protein
MHCRGFQIALPEVGTAWQHSGKRKNTRLRHRTSTSLTPAAFAYLMVCSVILPSWATGSCIVLEIAAHRGDFSEYVNGIYSAGEDNGILTNGRLAYQKVGGGRVLIYIQSMAHQ